MNHFYYITSKEFDNIFLDGVIQWCVDFLLKCQLGCPAVQESDHLGQHVWCTLACAHISLFGSHNNPTSSQGKDRSRITYVSTGEEPEFRKVKLFSHVIHITGNSPVFGSFPAVPDNVCLFSNKSLVYLVTL